MGKENVTSNSSDIDWVLGKMRIVNVAIYCVIFVVGLLGNGLVIYVTGFRMKRTVNSVWFLNLALADFLFTAFLLFSIWSLSLGYQWNFGMFMCKLNSFVSLVNMFASVFLLMAISLDRCLSIWVVVWAQNKRTVRKAQLISAAIWKKLKQSICFVLESALAEDHLSFMSSRSLSSHLSRFSRKSDSVTPTDKTCSATPLNFTDRKGTVTDAKDILSTD
ncbi:hypothetical protein Q5P01_011069 [Channa striata]|uniref:G-protein coupled receptors family 1 profile domain-containing protein n=1 Tax=Channa striata TaxID=64152 RepID=A0AA88MSP3_CHASR|nr:hypothetical protein Q5P01_011069 [Channa striata]